MSSSDSTQIGLASDSDLRAPHTSVWNGTWAVSEFNSSDVKDISSRSSTQHLVLDLLLALFSLIIPAYHLTSLHHIPLPTVSTTPLFTPDTNTNMSRQLISSEKFPPKPHNCRFHSRPKFQFQFQFQKKERKNRAHPNEADNPSPSQAQQSKSPASSSAPAKLPLARSKPQLFIPFSSPFPIPHLPLSPPLPNIHTIN